MVRTLVCALAVLALGTGAATLRADDKKSDKDKKEATITKVDPKSHTVTVRMKDHTGEETERTFTLTEDVRYFDSTGKAAALDVFRFGDYVLVVEREGKLKEVHKKDKAKPGGGK